jgi:hypothetical protein
VSAIGTGISALKLWGRETQRTTGRKYWGWLISYRHVGTYEQARGPDFGSPYQTKGLLAANEQVTKSRQLAGEFDAGFVSSYEAFDVGAVFEKDEQRDKYGA